MRAPSARIIVIDQTPADLIALAAGLSAEFDFECASSAQEGMARLKSYAPALILVGESICKMEGVAACHQLAAQFTQHGIPVIFVTALNTPDFDVSALWPGAADCITRPINLSMARQRIRNLVEREQLRRQLELQRDRIKLEEARRTTLEDQLRKLNAALDQSPASVIITDLQGCLQYVNPRFTEVTGYSAAESLGQNPRMLQSGLTSEATYVNMWETLSRGEVWKGKLINKRKNGEVFWEEAQIAPIKDEHDSITHYVAVKTDISELKQSEAALIELNTQLQESIEFQSALMEAIPIPIFYKNAQGRYLGFNHAYEVFMRRSRTELIGRSVFEIAPKELADIYHAQDLALMAQRGVQVYETQVKDGAGSVRDVMFSKACFTDHTGEVRGLIGCLLDITEQKQSERALALSEQRLTEAQRTSHIGNWELDLVSGELICSDEIYRIFEIDKTHFGASFDAFLAMFHPDDRAEVSAAYARSLDTRQPYAIDHRLLLPDGRIKYVHEACETSFSDAGQPLRSRGTVQDITPRKLLENQIRQLAFYDPLTGLPNRRLLDDRLRLAIASSKRSGLCCALMFLDLDNFKPLNDAHGHAVGDLLLTEVATRLKNCVREIDTVARLGGDEFVVLLDKLSLDKDDATAQSLVVAQKILAALATPYQMRRPRSTRKDAVVQHHCSASMGVVVFRDHEANQVDILKWADAAMYQAKEAGRNTVRFHEPSATAP